MPILMYAASVANPSTRKNTVSARGAWSRIKQAMAALDKVGLMLNVKTGDLDGVLAVLPVGLAGPAEAQKKTVAPAPYSEYVALGDSCHGRPR